MTTEMTTQSPSVADELFPPGWRCQMPPTWCAVDLGARASAAAHRVHDALWQTGTSVDAEEVVAELALLANVCADLAGRCRGGGALGGCGCTAETRHAVLRAVQLATGLSDELEADEATE